MLVVVTPAMMAPQPIMMMMQTSHHNNNDDNDNNENHYHDDEDHNKTKKASRVFDRVWAEIQSEEGGGILWQLDEIKEDVYASQYDTAEERRSFFQARSDLFKKTLDILDHSQKRNPRYYYCYENNNNKDDDNNGDGQQQHLHAIIPIPAFKKLVIIYQRLADAVGSSC